MSEFIGNWIRLTDADNRYYTGVLSAISSQTSTIDLSDVDVLDGSGRVVEHKDSVRFKGKEVQDLKVIEKRVVESQRVGIDESTIIYF